MGMIIILISECSHENFHVKCLTHCLAHTKALKNTVISPDRQNENYFVLQLSTLKLIQDFRETFYKSSLIKADT